MVLGTNQDVFEDCYILGYSIALSESLRLILGGQEASSLFARILWCNLHKMEETVIGLNFARSLVPGTLGINVV